MILEKQLTGYFVTEYWVEVLSGAKDFHEILISGWNLCKAATSIPGTVIIIFWAWAKQQASNIRNPPRNNQDTYNPSLLCHYFDSKLGEKAHLKILKRNPVFLNIRQKNDTIIVLKKWFNNTDFTYEG